MVSILIPEKLQDEASIIRRLQGMKNPMITPCTLTYIGGGTELLEAIGVLWENLNRHHQSVSPYFQQDFSTYTFAQRKAKLREVYAEDAIHIDIALCRDQPVGYIISAVTQAGIGEIESVFVAANFRGHGIGDCLMQRALTWLDEQRPETIVVKVAVGNEQAYPFYARYGFYPRVVVLKQKGY